MDYERARTALSQTDMSVAMVTPKPKVTDRTKDEAVKKAKAAAAKAAKKRKKAKKASKARKKQRR